MTTSGENRRVLVIDDTEAIHEDFRKILRGRANGDLDALESELFGSTPSPGPEPETFEVGSAFQGQDGLKEVERALAEGRPYAVAFVDMRMPPGWDGLETIERCWKVDPDLHVVICTAYSDYSWDEILKRVGMSDKLLILKKPFDHVEVRQLAATLVRKWKLSADSRLQVSSLGAQVEARTAELARTTGRLKQVIQAAPSALICVAPQGTVTEWNHAAEVVLGIKSELAIGSTLDALAIDWDSEAILGASRGSTATRETVALDRVRFRRPGGGEGFLSVSVTSFETSEGRSLLILCDDITERIQLERQLVQAQKLESIGQLAAGIAHEINTPMQFIGDNVHFLQTAFDDARKLAKRVEAAVELSDPVAIRAALVKAGEDVEIDFLREQIPIAIAHCLEGASRVSKIVHAMKCFSHPGSETARPSNLNEAIETTAVISRNEWKYAAELTTELDSTLPLVDCRLGEINQVLLNMVINASHAIAEAHPGADASEGRLVIRTRRLDGQVEIQIEDNGAGIPEAARGRIFDPFFTTKEVGKGTGQGLALAHAVIVKNHGGTISFTTEVGKGTTFFLRIPLHQPRADVIASERTGAIRMQPLVM